MKNNVEAIRDQILGMSIDEFSKVVGLSVDELEGVECGADSPNQIKDQIVHVMNKHLKKQIGYELDVEDVFPNRSRVKTRGASYLSLKEMDALGLVLIEPIVVEMTSKEIPAEEIADLFVELSTLYRMIGGKGLEFSFAEALEDSGLVPA